MQNRIQTKISKSFRPIDVVIKMREDIADAPNVRVILEGDEADGYLKGLLLREAHAMEAPINSAKTYVKYQEAKQESGGIIVPEVLEKSAQILLEYSKRLEDVAKKARKASKRPELVKSA